MYYTSIGRITLVVALTTLCCLLCNAWADDHSVVKIPEGRFAPLYGLDKGQTGFTVKSFWIDVRPVNQGEFYNFIKQNPEWEKKRVLQIYADSHYLENFKSIPPKKNFELPAVFISWFAASAYCEKKGGRLPTILEWEYVAAASELKANATRDPEFVNRLLSWYSKPMGSMRKAGSGATNYYGVRDLHGLIWEWTADFNSVFVTSDNRQDGDKSTAMFCGSGAIGASNRADYAAFMRYAMRSSVNANFALANTGFRCVYDDIKNKK